MSNPTDLKTTRDLVNASKLWLVTEGDRIGRLARRNREWKNQVRTIWEAARTENEPAVLLNLLRYQAARNDNWYKPENAFEPLHAAIEKCVTEAAADSARGMALIRHLLAYTYRSYTFHEEKRP
jgi:hypothetical protein